MPRNSKDHTSKSVVDSGAAAESKAKRIAHLKQMVQSGTYVPRIDVIADELLACGHLSLHGDK